MRWGKAAAVALSQGYEVTAFRELITELKERNGAAEQKTVENKQEPATAPVSFLISCGSQLLPRQGELFWLSTNSKTNSCVKEKQQKPAVWQVLK